MSLQEAPLALLETAGARASVTRPKPAPTQAEVGPSCLRHTLLVLNMELPPTVAASCHHLVCRYLILCTGDNFLARCIESEVLGWVLLYELYKVALDDHYCWATTLE